MTRTSTRTSDLPPRRENSPSCSTWSSLACSGRRHLADLVEEHRAVVGELELARLVLDRAGEGAALEAEQLGLEQFGRERRAVHLDERLVAAARRRRGARARPVPCRCRSRRGSSTVTSVSATRSISSRTSAIRRAARRRAAVCFGSPAAARAAAPPPGVTLAVSQRVRRAARRVRRPANGLLTKSVAPSFIAWTTVAVRPCPDSTMTGTSRSIFLNAASASSPSIAPGITTSRITAAGRSARSARPRPRRARERHRVDSRATPGTSRGTRASRVVVDDHDAGSRCVRRCPSAHGERERGLAVEQARCHGRDRLGAARGTTASIC